MAYNFKEVEEKWQKYWDENKTFATDVWDFSKPKFYALDMFPYPSRTRFTRWSSRRLYCYRYCFKNEKNARLQCSSPYGMGCIWPSC